MATESNNKCSDVEIREAKVEDCEDIIRLIQELADYEKMPNGPKIDAATLRKDGFGSEPLFQCLVAESASAKKLVGFAVYFFTYSTWKGASVYLDDLYVTPTFRHGGVGTRLWRTVAKVATDRKCRRMDWICLEWNQRAIELYKSKGSRNLTREDDFSLFRLDEQELINFANGV